MKFVIGHWIFFLNSNLYTVSCLLSDKPDVLKCAKKVVIRRCRKCNKELFTLEAYNDHIFHCWGTLLKCPHCVYTTYKRKSYRNHVHKTHFKNKKKANNDGEANQSRTTEKTHDQNANSNCNETPTDEAKRNIQINNTVIDGNGDQKRKVVQKETGEGNIEAITKTNIQTTEMKVDTRIEDKSKHVPKPTSGENRTSLNIVEPQNNPPENEQEKEEDASLIEINSSEIDDEVITLTETTGDDSGQKVIDGESSKKHTFSKPKEYQETLKPIWKMFNNRRRPRKF